MNVITKFRAILLFVLLFSLLSCYGQTKVNNQKQNKSTENKKIVGGGCDGCELMFVGIPENIQSVDTSAGWTEKGQKLLVTGTAFKLDGKTPAPNVVIYYWQTDNNGYYSPKNGMDEKAKRHGHIRGWVKTDENGEYSIYTIRPASYGPEEHIHVIIKETDKNPYTIDDFLFDDDPKLTADVRRRWRNRGGSGIVKPIMENGLLLVNRDIILGLNIPNYE